VTMMTLHMAKGLEFDRVYLVGLEDGLLPHFNSCDDKDSIEEERRLLYVGMTRAKKKLSLTAAYMRHTWGQVQTHDVSRFLREIPPEFVNVLTPPGGESGLNDHDDAEPGARDPEDGSQYYDYTAEDDVSSESLIEPGSAVYHPTYGSGTVEQIEMNYGRAKVLVRFKDVGLRRVESHHLSPRP
jgi:DNA helicase II / ATP-dependent DNA helicase PcrA